MKPTELIKSMPYRLAFIGGSIKSAIGYTHCIASKMDNRFILEAGCFSLDDSENKDTARQYGVSPARVYETWQELLKKEKYHIDVIVILTPTPSHFEIVSQAVQSGYAIICEKALAINSSEGESIHQLVKDNNGFLAVTYNYSGYPMLRELKQRIVNGEFGKLHQIHIEMPQEGFLRSNQDGTTPLPQKWRQKDLSVPGITLDLGTHCHHLIYFLTGLRPQTVIADQANYGFIPDVIDNVTVMLRYQNDFRAQIWYSKTALGHRNGLKLRLFGSKASAEWVQENPETLIINQQTGEKQFVDRSSISSIASQGRYNRFKAGHPSGFIEAFANLYMDISDCLEDFFQNGTYHSDHVFGTEHALEGLHLFESMHHSLETNTWVELEDSQDSNQKCMKTLKHSSLHY